MGSLIGSAPPVVEDVDDVPPGQSVCIDIEGGSSQVTHEDLQRLEERVNLLLAATTREQSALNARLDELRQLDVATTLASAARDCAAAAKAAVELLEGAKEAVDLLASDEFVQEQLESHARNAAIAIRETVVNASAQAAAAVGADVKRAMGGKKR